MLWNEENLKEALSGVRLPGQKQNIVEAGLLRAFEQKEETLVVEVVLPEPNPTFQKSLEYQIQKAINSKDESISVGVQFLDEASQPKIPKIGSILLIGSGKGGVGKSAVTVNLAASLKKQGYKVGILDCDLYGPSIPTMMGVEGKKPYMLEGKIQPIDAHGIPLMSAGFFVEDGQGLVWRGPMIHKLIQQFYQDVDWDGIDVLLVDLPPGTGDAPLSLSQTMPVNGALLVSLPQKLSIIDVHKAYAMFQQVKIPVAGIIENMSEFVCPSCDVVSEIFPRGGVKEFAKKLDIPFLGDIPIEPKLRASSDKGLPFVIEFPDSRVSAAFDKLAERLQPMLRKADDAQSDAVSFVL